MSLVKKRFGISKAVFEIEQLLFHCSYVKEKTYLAYLKVSEAGKQRYRKRIEEIIREYVLNTGFIQALAQDIVEVKRNEEGELEYRYNIDSNVFQFIKKNWYKGDSRKLLGDLMEVLKEK